MVFSPPLSPNNFYYMITITNYLLLNSSIFFPEIVLAPLHALIIEVSQKPSKGEQITAVIHLHKLSL